MDMFMNIEHEPEGVSKSNGVKLRKRKLRLWIRKTNFSLTLLLDMYRIFIQGKQYVNHFLKYFKLIG